MSDQQALDKAAEAAQKLAASTNTKSSQSAAASQWQFPYNFSPSFVAPPNFGFGPYGYNAYQGIQGMNFACPTQQPSTIPQMQQSAPKDSQTSVSNSLPPGFNPAQFSQFPPPSYLPGNSSNATASSNSSSFSNYQNYGNYSQSNQSWGNSHQQNTRNQQQQNSGSTPKPIRFSLPNKRGGALAHGLGSKAQQQSFNSNTANTNGFPGNNNVSNGGIGVQQNGLGYQSSGSSYAKVAASQVPISIQQNNTGTEYSNQNSLSNAFTSHNTSSVSNKGFQNNRYGRETGGGNSQTGSKDISQAMDPSDWPDSLQQYVYRCYELCSSSVDKDRVDIILRGKVTRAAQDGVLQTKDWLKEPLPEISGGQVKMLPFAVSSPIKGKITGKPIKTDDYVAGHGGGNNLRGGRGGSLGSKQQNTRNNKWGSGKGRGGRNVFRSPPKSSASPTRSRSRSRSMDSSGSSSSSSEYAQHSKKIKRRRRSSSESSTSRKYSPKQSKSSKKKNRRAAKMKAKTNTLEKKGKEVERVERVNMYSEYGVMQLDEDCRTTAKIAARAARFAKENKPQSAQFGKVKGRLTMKNRLGGFASRPSPSSSNGALWTLDTLGSNSSAYEDNDWSGTVVIGTSSELEKRYLRLTTAPDASTIRPENILKESLELVKRKWKENQDYFYACDQLKSIRQDLTVQRIRNHFTVYVYETHARIALEKGDHEEYNQCQSQLVQLYDCFPSAPNKIEFTAYRILYCIFTANTLDLGHVMSKLTDAVKKDECVAHALELKTAWALKNYSKFFKLHSNAPKMAGYLIDWFANRERKHALKTILKAYRPSVPTSYVKEQLGLPLDSQWTDFLTSTNLENTIVYMDSPVNSKINAKDSFPLVMSALS